MFLVGERATVLFDELLKLYCVAQEREAAYCRRQENISLARILDVSLTLQNIDFSDLVHVI